MIILTFQSFKFFERMYVLGSMPASLMSFLRSIMSSFSFSMTLNGEDSPAMRHVRLMLATGIEDCYGIVALVA
jgi:hypothetical protein